MEKRMLKPIEICDEIIDVYTHKAHYPIMKSVILGILAGMFIALGGFAAAVASHNIPDYGVAKLVSGVVFPVGLIMIIIVGTDLFTGNVLITVPFVNGDIKIKELLRNWLIIYLSNFIGAFIIALLISGSGILESNTFKLGGYALKVAITKASITPSRALFSGILCNILVCLAVWLSLASKDIIGKIFAVWFPVMAFIIGGFEHSVANMYYFSIALLSKGNEAFAKSFNISAEKLEHLNITDILVNNMIPVTLGNIIGGGFFVGIAIWAAFKYFGKTEIVNNDKKNGVCQ